MVNYWKSKVLPKIKKVFENPKKTAAVEACKAFDESKEQYSTEFEDKKSELQPKVIEIYEASSTEIKSLVKQPKETGLKKHSAAVKKFLDELAKIEFPGSKPACEAATKFGPNCIPGPIFFIFEKVSTFAVIDEKKEETETATTEEKKEEGNKEEEPSEVSEKEIVAAPPTIEESVEPQKKTDEEEEDAAPKAETTKP